MKTMITPRSLIYHGGAGKTLKSKRNQTRNLAKLFQKRKNKPNNFFKCNIAKNRVPGGLKKYLAIIFKRGNNMTLEQDNKKLVKKQLKSPKDFRNEDYHGKACFSRDYKLYGFFDNWSEALKILNNLPKGENMFNELIMDTHRVKPYLDVEWWKNDFEDYKSSEVKEKIKRCLVYIFRNSYDFDLHEEDIYFSRCHREADKGYKNSFHVVISTKPRSIVFENSNHASFLARQVRDLMDKYVDENYELAESEEEIEKISRKTKKLVFDGSVVDTGVYKKTQNMRLVHHIKNGSDVPFTPEDGEDLKNYIITDICDNPFVIKGREQDDELYTCSGSELSKTVEHCGNEDIEIIIEKVKKIHPSACFIQQDSSGYLQFNYNDRKEPCFTGSEARHDQIGFFVYVCEGIVYAGCHSGNCVCVKENKKGEEEVRKMIKNLGYLRVSAPSANQPVSHDELFSIDFDKVCRNVGEGAQGLATLFREMYLSPKRIKSQVSPGSKGGMDLFYWDGKIWKEDDRGFIEDIMSVSLKKLLQDFLKQSGNLPGQTVDEELIKQTRAMVNKLKNNMFAPNIMKSVKPYLDDKEFAKNKDIHPYLMACKNGMVDLRNGEIRDSTSEDNITRTIQTEYKADSDSSDFEKFVRQITSDESGEQPEVYDYFKWCIGYSLQGAPKKKLFLLLYGPHGFNGKSLVMNTIKDTLENYAVAMDSSVVLDSGNGKTPGSHTTEIMQLENCRIGILSDTPEDACINDGRMKQLTGGTDTMSGREIYGKQRDFKPVFVPFISTNHLIRINLADMAMYERLILFPFVLSFVDRPDTERFSYQRKADNDLAEKFASNREGVLKWLIDASIYYHSCPEKAPPQYLLDAKEDYNRQVNPHKSFVEETLEFTEDPSDIINRKKLLDMYKSYVTAAGSLKYYKAKVSQTEFDRIMPVITKGATKYYSNVKIKVVSDEDEDRDNLDYEQVY